MISDIFSNHLKFRKSLFGFNRFCSIIDHDLICFSKGNETNLRKEYFFAEN